MSPIIDVSTIDDPNDKDRVVVFPGSPDATSIRKGIAVLGASGGSATFERVETLAATPVFTGGGPTALNMGAGMTPFADVDLTGATDSAGAMQARLDYAGQRAAFQRTTQSVFLPPGTYKYLTRLTVPQGVNVVGCGGATKLRPQNCDGMFFGVDTGVTPQSISNFWIEGSAQSGTQVAFRVSGTATATDRRYGLTFRDLHIGFFNVAFYFRSTWEANIFNVKGYSVGSGVIVLGQTCRLRIDSNSTFIQEGFTPSSPIAGETSVGLYVDQAADYNPGGTTAMSPEDVQAHGVTFLGFAKGAYVKRFLVCILRDCIFDFCGQIGIQFRESAGLVIEGGYIATGYSLAPFSYGILADALPADPGTKASIKGIDIFGAAAGVANCKGILLQDNQNCHTVVDHVIQGFTGTGSAAFEMTGNRGCYVDRSRLSGTRSLVISNQTGPHNIGVGNYYSVPPEIQPFTFPAGDTNPDVMGVRVAATANAAATSVTTFRNGFEGQEIRVLVNDPNTTFVYGSTLIMQGGVNYAAPNGAIVSFVRVGGSWREASRRTA